MQAGAGTAQQYIYMRGRGHRTSYRDARWPGAGAGRVHADAVVMDGWIVVGCEQIEHAAPGGGLQVRTLPCSCSAGGGQGRGGEGRVWLHCIRRRVVVGVVPAARAPGQARATAGTCTYV